MGNQPDSVSNFIDAVHILDAVLIFLQEAAVDADVIQHSVLDPPAILTAAFSYKERCLPVQR